MKSLVRSIGVAGGVLLCAGVQNASAQIADTVEFTTSFPFTVGYATVPAGSYTIRPDDDNPDILLLTGPQASVMFQTTSARAPQAQSKTEVVFKRYGNKYVLKDVWVEGSDTGAESMAVEAERHAARSAPAADQRVSAKKTADTNKNR
jgi:hypothetical protein